MFYVNLLPVKTFVNKIRNSSGLLSNQKNWRATKPPSPTFVSQNRTIQILRKPFSQNSKKKYKNFVLIIHVWRVKIKAALIQCFQKLD